MYICNTINHCRFDCLQLKLKIDKIESVKIQRIMGFAMWLGIRLAFTLSYCPLFYIPHYAIVFCSTGVAFFAGYIYYLTLAHQDTFVKFFFFWKKNKIKMKPLRRKSPNKYFFHFQDVRAMKLFKIAKQDNSSLWNKYEFNKRNILKRNIYRFELDYLYRQTTLYE